MNEVGRISNNERIMMLAIALCLFVGLFGFSFAYFTVPSPTVAGSLPKVQIDGLTETLEPGAGSSNTITYGAPVSADNLRPGEKIVKTFSIETSAEVSYSIKLNILKNSFVKCDATTKNIAVSEFSATYNNCTDNAKELVYTLKKGNTVVGTAQVDLTGVGDKTGVNALLKEISTQTTTGLNEYTLTIDYLDTNADQNHNKGAEFSAEVLLEVASS